MSHPLPMPRWLQGWLKGPRKSSVPTVEPNADRDTSLAEFGKAWLARHADVVAGTAVGTVIAVRFPDGAYVTAATGLSAIDAFEERFGKDARGWMHEVGVPISLGCGLWQLSSGA